MADFDINKVQGNDRVIAGAGIVALIASFLPWYGASAGGFSASVSGWSAGLPAVLAILLSLVATGYVIGRAMGQLSDLKLPVGPNLAVLALTGAAAVLIVVRWLTLPSYEGFGIDYGARFGLFLALVATLVQAAFALLSFRSSGEALPSTSSEPPAQP